MHLYILRHGVAEPGDGLSDADRELTAVGRAQSEDLGHLIRKLGVRFDAVWTSPYSRAQQTAWAATKASRQHDAITEQEWLEPGCSPRSVCKALQKGDFHKDSALLVVGHEPDLGRLLGQLLHGKDGPAIPLKKGAICKLRLEDPKELGRASLDWILTPGLISVMLAPG